MCQIVEYDESESEGEWTVVRSRRSPGSSGTRPAQAKTVTASTQSPPVPPRQVGQEASRRTEGERLARDSGRARPAEAGRGVGTGTVPGSTGVRDPETSSGAGTSRMGPPPPLPPPPPRRPPGRPPVPPATEVPESRSSLEAPPSTPRDAQPSAAPGRPAKRSLPWSGSPTDRESPKTRHKFRPGSTGRAHSADGRLRQGHPRVSFGEHANSGEEEKF